MIAFILGLLIGYLISWFFRKKQVDVREKEVGVAEERVAIPADKPARERDLSDDMRSREASADVKADAGVKVDDPALAEGDRTEFIAAPDAPAASDTDAAADAPAADTPEADTPAADTPEGDTSEPALSMIEDKDSGLGAGTGAAALGVAGAGAGAAALGSREEKSADVNAGVSTVDADVDTPAAGLEAQTPAADTDVATPAADAPSAPAAAAGAPDGEAAPVAESPYGAGSALPLAGGAAPSDEYTVKGNADSKLFHTTESPYYGRTKAEVWFKTPGDAEAAGFSPWNRSRAKTGAQAAAATPEPAATPIEPGAYPGSAMPLAGGAAPSAEYTVKGNEDSKLYHTTDSAFYEHTKAEVWFKTPAEAEAAGFTPWNQLRDQESAAAPVAENDGGTSGTAAAAAATGAIGGGTVLGANGQGDGSAPATEMPAAAQAEEPDTGRIPVQSAEATPLAAAAPAATAAAPATQAPATEALATESEAPESAPYGPGSALPLDGGAAPSNEYTVKGNADSKLFHTTESPYYPRTIAEVWFKTPADAEAAGFTAWNRRRGQQAVAAPSYEPGDYPNSAKPLDDGAAPTAEFTVKGNEDSKLFHTTESPYYPRTRAEVWFKTAADAESAGFTAWNRRRIS